MDHLLGLRFDMTTVSPVSDRQSYPKRRSVVPQRRPTPHCRRTELLAAVSRRIVLMPTATPTRTSGAASRATYFNSSRAPRYSVVFALPLLLGYEALAAMLASPGKAELRNGADAMLRAAFTAVAGPYGTLIFMAAIILLGVGLVARDLKRSKDRLRARVFLGMLAESVALA